MGGFTTELAPEQYFANGLPDREQGRVAGWPDELQDGGSLEQARVAIAQAVSGDTSVAQAQVLEKLARLPSSLKTVIQESRVYPYELVTITSNDVNDRLNGFYSRLSQGWDFDLAMVKSGRGDRSNGVLGQSSFVVFGTEKPGIGTVNVDLTGKLAGSVLRKESPEKPFGIFGGINAGKLLVAGALLDPTYRAIVVDVKGNPVQELDFMVPVEINPLNFQFNDFDNASYVPSETSHQLFRIVFPNGRGVDILPVSMAKGTYTAERIERRDLTLSSSRQVTDSAPRGWCFLVREANL